MVSNVKRITNILSVLLLFAAPLLVTSPVSAASASMSLSPGATSVAQGAILTVGVYENSGNTSVDAASVRLKYPANLLDFVGIASSSAFGIVAANSGGGGSVTIDRGSLSGVKGSQLIASVSFRAKTSSGTASITFASGSNVLSGGKALSGSKSGGTYTLTKPAAAPPAAKPKPKDTKPPTMKDVAATDTSFKKTTISWTTSEPSTSVVDYGLNNSYGLTAVNNKRVTKHKIVLSSALLTPGTTYHYRVKSVDAAGNAVASKDATFTTEGVPLTVTVTNKEDKKPLSQAKVNFGESSGVTDKNGQVTLKGLKEGKIVGVIDYKGKQTVVDVEIQPVDVKNPTQTASFAIEVPKTNPLVIILPLIALLLLVGTVLLQRNKAWMDALSKRMPGKGSGRGGGSPSSSSTPPETPSTPASSGPTVIKPTGS